MTEVLRQQHSQADRLLVQIASYNTNLQGDLGLPQDLVDWLAPTLQVSNFLSRDPRAPDIVAVGFQELLPLHLGLSGLSRSVINNRNALILSQIEAHAPGKEKYSLIAKVVNVGIALLVYGRDDGVSRKVCDVETAWTGCGPAFMGNKGAVGVRFRVPGGDDDIGETFTFVNCHLTAHGHKLPERIEDYRHITRTLLFSPLPGTKAPSTLYDTSHLFILGDLNFRLDIPDSHPLAVIHRLPHFSEAIATESTRKELKEFDQLTVEKRKRSIFVGLHEGEFWKFKCTYKYKLGKVDEYDFKRTPAWTDRVLYATHSDTPDAGASNISNLLYTSIPSYTTSDHKPVVALLSLPPPTASTSPQTLRLPSDFTLVPDRMAVGKRYLGRTLDRVVGLVWWLLTILGAGSGLVGIFNFIIGIGAWSWWKSRPIPTNHV